MDNPINTEVTPTPIQPENTPQVPIEAEKPKKKLPVMLIVIGILILLLVVYFLFFFFLKKDEDTDLQGTLRNDENIEESSDEESQETDDNDTYVANQDTEITDVSEYTDIKLKSYTGLNLGISIRDEEDENEDELINGIVTYVRRLTDEKKYSIESISIINKMVLTQKEITDYFTPTANDIRNKNIEAVWLGTGSPWILTTSVYGTAGYSTLAEIKDVNYANTDTTFAILSLAHGQEIAGAGEDYDNFMIQVYALKGDNIIGIQSNIGNLMKDLGLSTEDDSKCSKESSEDDYLIYDQECLSDVFESGKYDATLKVAAERLMMSFELAN